MTNKTSTINSPCSKEDQNTSSNETSYYASVSTPAYGHNSQRDALSSRQHVAILRDKLGFFDKIGVDWQSRAEAKRAIGELVVNLLEAQKQEILFRITLELADEKKRAFAESMRAGSQIEKEIAERSTEFERELIDLALDHGLAGHERKKTRLEQLEKRHLDGRIDHESLILERRAIEKWMHVFRDNLDAKVEIILRNHAQQIEKALTVFRERAISGHTY
jgi:phage-related minor tail protein